MNKIMNILLAPLPALACGFLAAMFFLFGYAYGSGTSDKKEMSNNTIVYLSNGTVQIDWLKIKITSRGQDDKLD